MSVEADLAAFRDLALEEQIKIPYYLKKYGDYDKVYDNLDPILDEMIGDRSVALVGEVYVPAYDSVGNYAGYERSPDSTEPIIGLANGVEVNSKTRLLTGEAGRLLVGYCVQKNPSTERELAHVPRFSFAPVESSTLMVPGLLVPERLIMPEGDDVTAFEIDSCLLGERMDLNKLMEVFDDLSNGSEMRMEYYLQYLNTVLRLSDYEITIQTEKIISGDYDGLFSVSEAQGGTVLELPINPDVFEYIDQLGLAMAVYQLGDDLEEDDYLLFPLRHIHKLSFMEK